MAISKDKALRAVQSILASMPDLDKILSGLCTTPKCVTVRTARTGIDTFIYLKQALKSASALEACLHESIGDEDTLLSALCENMKSNTFEDIQRIIDDTIAESVNYSKSSHEMRHQECFALKSGLNGPLDVARKSFLQTVEDIYEVRYDCWPYIL